MQSDCREAASSRLGKRQPLTSIDSLKQQQNDKQQAGREVWLQQIYGRLAGRTELTHVYVNKFKHFI